MPSRPWYPRYSHDYLGDTAMISLEAHGLYSLLLDYYWIYGPLPDDEIALARLLRIDRRKFRRTFAELLSNDPPYFFKRNGRIHNKRMDKEIAKTLEKSEKSKKSAQKRWDANAHAKAMPPQPQPQGIGNNGSSSSDPDLYLNSRGSKRGECEGGECSPANAGSPPKKKINNHKSGNGKGRRWGEDEIVPDAWKAWAQDVENLSSRDIEREALKFADYWRGRSGKDGVKINWEATWRNWVRRITDTR